MKVIEICYTDNTQTTVKTLYEDNTASYGPYPANDGPTRQSQDEFINSGGTITEYIPPPPPPITQVTAYQAKMALINAGLYTSVESFIQSANNLTLTVAWNTATTFERNSLFIMGVAPELGLTEEQIDELFLQASQIT